MAERLAIVGGDAAGVSAAPPPPPPDIPGAEAIEPARTLEDAERLRGEIGDGHDAVVVGAGYIGLEMAEALVRRGLRTALVEAASEVFPALDPDMGARVRDAAEGV